MNDDKKMQVLHLLHENSRLSVDTMATMLGVTSEQVKQAMTELEQSGIIKRYSAVIDWDKVESTKKVSAIIHVNVTPQREVGFDAIAERIYRFPEVRSVSLMSGTYDLEILLDGEDIREIARFVAEKLSTIEHVISTATHFLLKTYKADGVIFDDHERDRRLVVAP